MLRARHFLAAHNKEAPEGASCVIGAYSWSITSW